MSRQQPERDRLMLILEEIRDIYMMHSYISLSYTVIHDVSYMRISGTRYSRDRRWFDGVKTGKSNLHPLSFAIDWKRRTSAGESGFM
jgi:hypothetical protein